MRVTTSSRKKVVRERALEEPGQWWIDKYQRIWIKLNSSSPASSSSSKELSPPVSPITCTDILPGAFSNQFEFSRMGFPRWLFKGWEEGTKRFSPNSKINCQNTQANGFYNALVLARSRDPCYVWLIISSYINLIREKIWKLWKKKPRCIHSRCNHNSDFLLSTLSWKSSKMVKRVKNLKILWGFSWRGDQSRRRAILILLNRLKHWTPGIFERVWVLAESLHMIMDKLGKLCQPELQAQDLILSQNMEKMV